MAEFRYCVSCHNILAATALLICFLSGRCTGCCFCRSAHRLIIMAEFCNNITVFCNLLCGIGIRIILVAFVTIPVLRISRCRTVSCLRLSMNQMMHMFRYRKHRRIVIVPFRSGPSGLSFMIFNNKGRIRSVKNRTSERPRCISHKLRRFQ